MKITQFDILENEKLAILSIVLDLISSLILQNLSDECTLAKEAKEEINLHFDKAQKEVISLEKNMADLRSQLIVAKQQLEDALAEKDAVSKEKEEVRCSPFTA